MWEVPEEGEEAGQDIKPSNVGRVDGWMSEGMRRRRQRPSTGNSSKQCGAPSSDPSRKEAIENSFHGGRDEQVVLLMSQILMGRKETISNKGAFTS